MPSPMNVAMLRALGISTQGTTHCAANSSGKVPELASCMRHVAGTFGTEFGEQLVETFAALAERVLIGGIAEGDTFRK